jgi:hypothetical protein
MISSIVLKEHRFVLESDRGNLPGNQTVFWIIPKTVRGATETLAAYAKTQVEKRGKGRRDVDVKAMLAADVNEWVNAVKKVDNYVVLRECPGPTEGTSSYDHFAIKSKDEPSKYKMQEDGGIVVVSTDNPDDLKYIYWSMANKDVEEIISAYIDYNELKDSAKNS